MKSTTYLPRALGMATSEFMAEWKRLTDAEKDWYRNAARAECAALGIALDDATAT